MMEKVSRVRLLSSKYKMDPVALLPWQSNLISSPSSRRILLLSSSTYAMYLYTIAFVVIALRVQFAWSSPISREAPIIGVVVPSDVAVDAFRYGMGDSEERGAPSTEAVVNFVVGTSTAAPSSSTTVLSSA